VLVGAALASTLPGCQRPPEAEPLPGAEAPAGLELNRFGSGQSLVVEVRWGAAVSERGVVDPGRVASMLGAAVADLIGDPSPFREWAGAQRRIGIKVNTITCQAFTHPELASAIALALGAAGASADRLTVWDRDSSGLTARGFRLDGSGGFGFRCLGTDAVGQGRSRALEVARQRVYLSPLLLESDILVNVAALKDHSMAGVSLCLKNNFGMIQGAELLHGKIHEGSACEPAISELAASGEIRGRLGLCVLDALVGVCQGGPGSADPRHVFRHAGILVSRDPVALDRRGLEIIEARRALLGLERLVERTRPNPSPPLHIDNAAARGVSPA
jgi:uncharacterized protein (DUF362 family)